MARVKRGVIAHARHRKVIKDAKGYRGRSSSCFRAAVQRLRKARQYAYRDRRNKKRDFRGLWIQRINAAARSWSMTYSQFMHGIKLANISIDRKILADIAAVDGQAFGEIVAVVKAAIDKAGGVIRSVKAI